MFTVCPKCALTLVVTAADLRIAQGYVRCGRCSNVFNAIVGLSEDRSGQQAGTATTSIMRKAPSIIEEEAPPQDKLSDTGETEAIYAEPDQSSEDVSFQDVFVEAPQPAPSPPPKASMPPGPLPEFADSIPDVALEFNPEATDVSQVFIESAPAKKIDLRQVTGTFQQLRPESPPPAAAPPPPPKQASPPRQAATTARQPPPRQQPAPPMRDAEDAQLEDELRTLAARLDATGKQPALRSEPAPKPARPSPTRREPSEDVLVYQGSPYNSADEPTNRARKAAASAARRRLAEQPSAPSGETKFFDDGEDFDAPLADNANAFTIAAELTPRTTPRGRRLAWIGGGAALCVVLAAQAIHHNRHDLATNATLNRPLTRFYQAIGVSLVPRWNLASYEVRQLGAFSAPGDTGNLTVRASLKNNADQRLPLPLLRITVQDRYGNRIATRDVPPKGYAPGALPADALLAVGQRLDAEMSFKDPGRDAVGFEIDACLPTPEGRIACANDTVAVPAP